MKKSLPLWSVLLAAGAAALLAGACGKSGDDTGPDRAEDDSGDDEGLGVSGPCAVERADAPRGECASWFELRTDTALSADELSRVGYIAAGDLNGDGLTDVVMAEPFSVFENKGGLVFEPVAVRGDVRSTSTSVALADLDNDGDLDLVTSDHDWVEIHRNVGDFEFELMFEGTGSDSLVTHVLFADFDGDSFLDVFLSYPPKAAQDRPELPPVLFLSKGGDGFSPVGEDFFASYPTYAWSASLIDGNGDGRLDIFVAADGGIEDFGFEARDSWDRSENENRLFQIETDECLGAGGCRSDGVALSGATFVTEVATERELAGPHSSMGGLVEDFNGDGKFDLFVSDYGRNKLYLNEDGGFVESAVSWGLDASHRENSECTDGDDQVGCLLVSWSALFEDFNLDGENDLMIFNHNETGVFEQPPQLYQREQSGAAAAFVEYALGLGDLAATAALPSDFDADGDLDILLTTHRGVPVLLENKTAGDLSGRSMTVRLEGSANNRQGVGAEVVFTMESGATVMRLMGAGGVSRASLPAEVHVGLAAADTVETVVVGWPDGTSTTVNQPKGPILVISED